MAYPEPQGADREMVKVNPTPRKPRVLLAASGSVAAIKFGNLCHCFSEWAEVKAVATKASLHFIDRASLPKDLKLYTDEEEWSSWGKIGDSVLHIELRRWADIMVIAPLSANTLGKIAGGLCDNLLTCVIRAWDYSKPMFVAPAMNTFMWSNPFTEKHLMTIDELGISLIPPVSKRLACGDYGNGAMAEPSLIHSTVRLFLESRPQPSD
ncbi:hypothetical protein Goshw_020194 [Gossypium schwendimanii]|uniref:phosphopantothenoylcysteine decarboxylase n=4 Tax=Gossypium TaxID=3633 RepID=A0A7J9M5F3_GOSSC|nr:hypothetical protein [Gossypium lobatum]MBA0691597.1 hypothetical protein [Gossypium aridum]MBA0720609.1 hypothetical protein [Gossypium laxum]MBA0866345.1 hypothetical protein [Gossypium schwendimanii]